MIRDFEHWPTVLFLCAMCGWPLLGILISLAPPQVQAWGLVPILAASAAALPIVWVCSLVSEFRALRNQAPAHGVVPGFALLRMSRQPALHAALPMCQRFLPVCFLPDILMIRLKPRGDRVHVLFGLPLLATCSLEDLAILSRMAFYRQIEPRSRLHAWAYLKHRAAQGVLRQGSVPFRVPRLNVVLALTRHLSEDAERYARRRAGISRSVLQTAQNRHQSAAAHFSQYFTTRFYPLLQAGALPPLAEGFRNFLRERGIDVSPQPAYGSIDALWLLERNLVERGMGKNQAAELNAMSWADAEALILPRMVQRISWALRPVLKGRTLGDLPEVTAMWQRIACHLMQARTKAVTPDIRRQVVGQFVNYAVAHALSQAGWHLEGSPDRVLLRDSETVLDMSGPIQNLLSHAWGPSQFRDWAEQMRVAAVPL